MVESLIGYVAVTCSSLGLFIWLLGFKQSCSHFSVWWSGTRTQLTGVRERLEGMEFSTAAIAIWSVLLLVCLLP